MNAYLIIGIVIGIVALAFIVAHNRFVAQRQLIENAWSNIDTELRRRYDLIPNLVATVKGYAAHEQQTLDRVMQARAAAIDDHGTADHQAETENVLVSNLRGLFAVSERYPDLKASTHFLQLQRQLVTTEDRIQANRRIYNGNVRSYNQRLESVPTNLVAAISGFKRAGYFEVDPALRIDEAAPVGFDVADL